MYKTKIIYDWNVYYSKKYNYYYVINYVLSIPRLLKIQDASDKNVQKEG